MKNGIVFPAALILEVKNSTNPPVFSFPLLLWQKLPTGGAILATATYTAAPIS